MIPTQVFDIYGFSEKEISVTAFGTGLINHTWLVEKEKKKYILQKINTHVFRNPDAIHDNLQLIGKYLEQNTPGYLFVGPVTTLTGTTLVKTPEGCFRLFPFVEGSHAKSVLQNAEQAYEAAKQFGRFTALLSGFDPGLLKETIPHFHDITLRYGQFETALRQRDAERIQASQTLIHFLQQQKHIADRYEEIKQDPSFRIRVTHHDTKISNVLFDENDQALCVIDLDTVMPGYFISDIGDMMRTYLPTVSEEETDLSKIDIREDMYAAIVRGYLSEMKNELTGNELQSFFYAAQFLVYMQALRFITDHLNRDIYYGAHYPGQNFNRAQNQAVLLQKLNSREQLLKSIQ